MNAKKCKALRAHAGDLRAPTQYEKQVFRPRLVQIQTPAGVALDTIQCLQPMYLKRGSPRAVYKLMKRIESRMGLEVALQRLQGVA
ncbi:MAG: hypothetical protein Q7J84_10600 [Sulfuricaulis sp.]|nr:hypothetical protein [Sulfuricaulis sp.]